jgi:hypothetical protein
MLILMIPTHLAQELVRQKTAELHKQAVRRPAPRKRAKLPSFSRLTLRLKTNRHRRPVPVAEPECAL